MKLLYAIDINSTPEGVWHWLGTPERAMEWQTSVSQTEILKQTADMVGTTFLETVEGNGRSMEMRGVVTDYQENRSLGMHLSSKLNVVDVVWRLEEIDGGTRLNVDYKISFKSFIGVISFITRPIFKRMIMVQLEEDCGRLKTLCEADS